ncbi:MAG: Ig-like domain-containing protein [Pirellulales bacterium]
MSIQVPRRDASQVGTGLGGTISVGTSGLNVSIKAGFTGTETFTYTLSDAVARNGTVPPPLL